MFIIGFIIFCAYLFTLLANTISANNAQQKELENDPELKSLFDKKEKAISLVEWPEIIKKKPNDLIELYFKFRNIKLIN